MRRPQRARPPGMRDGCPRPRVGQRSVMTFLPAAVAESAVPADWVAPRLNVFAKPWMTGIVRPDFPAYAQVFRPLDDGPGRCRHDPGRRQPRPNREHRQLALAHGPAHRAGRVTARHPEPVVAAQDAARFPPANPLRDADDRDGRCLRPSNLITVERSTGRVTVASAGRFIPRNGAEEVGFRDQAPCRTDDERIRNSAEKGRGDCAGFA